jgi:hypothetical protein
MNLPNYFLADLPPEAALTASMLKEACETLRHNREQFLAQRSTDSLIRLLSGIGANWLDPHYPFRKLALEKGPESTGFSKPTLAKGLDALFAQFTVENFRLLLEQDLGHKRRLDEMSRTAPEDAANRAAIASAPELIVHVTAGNIPSSSIQSIAFGLLLRSAQFVKCASGASFIPRLFVHSLYEADPKIGACLEIAEWRGGNREVEEAVFENADCVTASASDETIDAIRKSLPVRVKFIGYGHRMSFAYIAASALTKMNAERLAERAVTDIVAWDQQGCLSPHICFVERGGHVSVEQFAELIAERLENRERTEPRGRLDIHAANTISSRRSFYEVRAANSPDTRLWQSQGSTAWTVIFETTAAFQASCLNRFIYVKEVSDLTQMMQSADTVRGRISTVGLAASVDETQVMATELARWGVTRICPLGKMQNPPLGWRHDGRPALADFVRWSDWEME